MLISPRGFGRQLPSLGREAVLRRLITRRSVAAPRSVRVAQSLPDPNLPSFLDKRICGSPKRGRGNPV